MDTFRRSERFTIGCAVLVLVAAALSLGIARAQGAFEDTMRVTAVFASGTGQGLDRFSPVRVRGVEVGRVAEVTLDRDGRTAVALELDADLDVPADVAVRVEPVSVFGPRVVDLVLDDARAADRLVAGAVLVDATAADELSDLVASATDLLTAIDPGRVRAVLSELATGLDGRGPQLARTFDALDDITAVLDDRTPETVALVDDLRALSDRFAGRGRDVVAAARTVADGTAFLVELEDDLAALLDEVIVASPALVDLLGSQREVLGPLLGDLRRATITLVRNLDLVPDLVDGFDAFFRLFGDIARLPGPDGSLQLAVDLFVGNDLCEAVQTCDDLVPEALRDPFDLVAGLLDALGPGEEGRP